MGSYTGSCQNSSRGGSSASSTNSYTSVRSKSTAPTIFSDLSPLKRGQSRDGAYGRETEDSVSTSASSSSSVEWLPEGPQYDVIDRRQGYLPSEAVPSNPPIFADLFPSSRRLRIRHDDTTLDGNMNLRVDTLVTQRNGYQQDVILFHLRMYDLYPRRFSLRRYCRDSGREVCHSTRKPVSSRNEKRSLFSRPWSSMLSALRPGSSGNQGISPRNILRRQDSGNKFNDGDLSCRNGGSDSGDKLSNTIMLEFSNYAHVEVNRRGTNAAKKYEYEYWSTKYQWRRGMRKEGDLREASYHLVNLKTGKTVAHLVPDILTPLEAVEEASKGGWIPPSSMWINDSFVYDKMPDIADVIVATGLAVLVDDCIHRRWHSKGRSRRAPVAKSIELMGPKKLFQRKWSS